MSVKQENNEMGQYLDRILTPLKTFLHFLGYTDKKPDA